MSLVFFSAIPNVAAYREPRLLPWQQELIIIRDGPLWFITMVIGPGCLALQPDFIVSASNMTTGEIM